MAAFLHGSQLINMSSDLHCKASANAFGLCVLMN